MRLAVIDSHEGSGARSPRLRPQPRFGAPPARGASAPSGDRNGACHLALAAIVSFATALSACKGAGEAEGSPAIELSKVESVGAPSDGATGVTPRTKAPPAADELSAAFARTAAAVRPSVVRIEVESSRPLELSSASPRREAPPSGNLHDVLEQHFGPPRTGSEPQRLVRATGSGFLLDEPPGHIVTNSHVIHGADRVTVVISEGRRFPAKIIGEDPESDVGLLRFETSPPELTAARLGNSDALRVGQWVLAIGSPHSLEQSVTAGIVSGLGKASGRMRLSGARVREYIQTDALINPTNSGGPLVNLSGEVIGINTLIDIGAGGSYGFAIPINQAKQVAHALVREGRVRYPYLGLLVTNLQDMPEALRGERSRDDAEQGAYVSRIAPGGPAARAGLKPGDLVTEVDGSPVESADQFVERIAEHEIGEKLRIGIVRNGDTRHVALQIAELPTQVDEDRAKLGIVLQTLDESLAQALGLAPQTTGAVVAQVQPDSPAHRAGLVPGDVIVQIDRRDMSSAEQTGTVLRQVSDRPRLLRVLGAQGARFVTIKGDP